MKRFLSALVLGLLHASVWAQDKPSKLALVGKAGILKASSPGDIPGALTEKAWDQLLNARQDKGELGKLLESKLREDGLVYYIPQGTKVMVISYSVIHDAYLVVMMSGSHYHDGMYTAPYFVQSAPAKVPSKKKDK